MGAGQSMDAEVAKKNAEAAATTKVASAEAAKLDAEAVATTQRAAADAAADFRKKAAWWTSAAVGAAVGAAVVVGLTVLSADFYRHESPAHIKRRMRSLLLSFKVPGENVPESSMLIKIPQLSLFESFTTKPTVLVGKSGCGKSTLLVNTARALVSSVTAAGTPKEPTPTCLVSIRVNTSREGTGRDSPHPNDDAVEAFSETAAKIFAQIGAPTRRALIYKFVPNGIKFSNEFLKIPVMFAPTGGRVTHMLELLLETAAEITKERLARGIPVKEAVVVLLWDEMHDLIKDLRFASVGGKYVFDFLSRQLVVYGTTQGLIRAVVTGSSAELLFKLEQTSVASGERVVGYELQDPPEDEVQKALVKVGYSNVDAARIVQLCGTRLRQFENQFRYDLLIPLDEFIQRRDQAAKRQYSDFFAAIGLLQDGGSTYAAVIKLLDRIEASEANRSHTPPSWLDVPQSAFGADIFRLIFIGLDSNFRFQSRVHRRVWGFFRARLSDPAMSFSSKNSRGNSGDVSGGSGGDNGTGDSDSFAAKADASGKPQKTFGVGIKKLNLGDL